MTNEVKTPIPARLYNAAVGGHVAGTEDIYDDTKGKTQKQINTEVEQSLGSGGSVDERIATEGAKHYLKSETYTKDEVHGLITTPNQQYITVTAINQTTAVTDVLPASGEADTVYRVGNWDGSAYDDTVYSEYAWNGTAYVFLRKKDYGIDDEPTANSNNLVKSGGIISFVRDVLKCVSIKPQVVDGGVNKWNGMDTTGTTKRTDFIEIPNDSGILVKGAIGSAVTPIALYSSNTIDSFIEAEQNNELVYYPSSYIKSVGAKYIRYCIGATQYNNDDYCILFTDKNIDEEIKNINEEINNIDEEIKNIPLIARSSSASYNGTTITIDIVSTFSITGEKKDYYADGDSTQHSPVTYNLDTGHLVITESGSIEQRNTDSAIQTGDIILLSYNVTQQRFVGGLLYADYVNVTANSSINDIKSSINDVNTSINEVKSSIKQFVVSSSARVISDNILGLTFVRIKDSVGNDKMIYVNNEHTEEEFTFNASTLGVLVVDENDAIVSRDSFASIALTDFVLLAYTGSVNRFTAGALLPYLAYSKPSGSEPATSYSATVYRNICIALLNKLGERLGMEKSTFLGVDGSSKVCARDMVWMIIAGITNNFISSVWCKDVVYAPVYGTHARLDTYESSFVDTVSHPMVADLSDYYHIWGGKTGSALINNVYVGKNLCIAVKSKTDDSWLVGCVLNSTADVQGDNRFSVMKQLFDLLETHRDGTSVDPSSLRCEAAYALVLPNNGNILSYHTYNDFVYVSKNGESLITDSRSITKVMTALVVLENLNVNEKIHVTADDLAGYVGHSGSMYQDGDEIYVDDAITTLLLTSSSHACWFLARRVGQEFMKHNPDLQLYAFRLAGTTAYGVDTQTWLQWLDTPDYLVWSAKTGLTITCSGSDANVELNNGYHIYGVTGGSVISKSTMYNAVP